MPRFKINSPDKVTSRIPKPEGKMNIKNPMSHAIEKANVSGNQFGPNAKDIFETLSDKIVK